MLTVEMLPAERGDAILVEYGPGDGTGSRILVDGGPVNSGLYDGVHARLLDVPVAADGRRHFDLLVVTHVDADHVEGVIRLLQDDQLKCVFDDIWFNGWKHLERIAPDATVEVLGAAQGEFFGALLVHQGRPWNQYFGGGAIVVADDRLPVCELRGGMRLTLLSPTLGGLDRLAHEWETAVKSAGFTPGDADAALRQLEGAWWARPPVLGEEERIRAATDHSAANGSSIAFLAEFGGRAILLSGDAHDDVLTASLRRVRNERALRKRLRIDALKLSHHGSERNTTRQLLAEVSSDHYLVSTNGQRFDHPDALTIRTVVDHHRRADRPVLCFNYEQPQTMLWRDDERVDTRYGTSSVVRLDTP